MTSGYRFDQQHIIRADSLQALAWLQHGFGTRLPVDWPPTGRVVMAKQVHSDRVLVANGETCGVIGEGDALITSQPGTVVGIRTADCLPILIADPQQHSVAAIHAGWRGTVAHISSNTVEMLTHTFGSRSGDLIAVIGPGIGQCCFEVGPEVASQFGAAGRTRISLSEVNRRQLEEAGIPSGQITVVDECTYCGGEWFHSYRRDREAAGRMVSAIGIRE